MNSEQEKKKFQLLVKIFVFFLLLFDFIAWKMIFTANLFVSSWEAKEIQLKKIIQFPLLLRLINMEKFFKFFESNFIINFDIFLLLFGDNKSVEIQRSRWLCWCNCVSWWFMIDEFHLIQSEIWLHVNLYIQLNDMLFIKEKLFSFAFLFFHINTL